MNYDFRNVFSSCIFVVPPTIIVFINLLCLLGVSASVLATTVPPPKSASEAIADIDRVLGDPNVFVSDIWEGVNAFVGEHFGAMAVATGFGIAIRTITK